MTNSFLSDSTQLFADNTTLMTRGTPPLVAGDIRAFNLLEWAKLWFNFNKAQDKCWKTATQSFSSVNLGFCFSWRNWWQRITWWWPIRGFSTLTSGTEYLPAATSGRVFLAKEESHKAYLQSSTKRSMPPFVHLFEADDSLQPIHYG